MVFSAGAEDEPGKFWYEGFYNHIIKTIEEDMTDVQRNTLLLFHMGWVSFAFPQVHRLTAPVAKFCLLPRRPLALRAAVHTRVSQSTWRLRRREFKVSRCRLVNRQRRQSLPRSHCPLCSSLFFFRTMMPFRLCVSFCTIAIVSFLSPHDWNRIVLGRAMYIPGMA